MAGISAKPAVDLDGDRLGGGSDSLMKFAILACARFPEVTMALGKPSLAREFELPAAGSASIIIEETADCKLVQVVLRRAGASSPAFLHCTSDHQQADRMFQSRNVVGNPESQTYFARPGNGSTKEENAMQAAEVWKRWSSCATDVLEQDIAGLCEPACGARICATDAALDSATGDRTELDEPGVVDSCALIEDVPLAEAEAMDSIWVAWKSDRRLKSNAIATKRDGGCAVGLAVGVMCPPADRVSPDASSAENAMATRKALGHHFAGGPAHQDWNSGFRNAEVRQAQAQEPGQRMAHVHDATLSCVATAPHVQTKLFENGKQQGGGKVLWSSLGNDCVEPATPRSRRSYRPWGRNLHSRGCRTGTPIASTFDTN